ncbi:MAG: hypothetical protein PHT27_07675 [Candidatus Izemoplasmatales bacterium]|nr:hypothetical protein [Candidatus Izemoplasmatales bacterium]
MEKQGKKVYSFSLSDEAMNIIRLGAGVTKCRSVSAFVENTICGAYQRLDPDKEISELNLEKEEYKKRIEEIEKKIEKAEERRKYFDAVKENREKLKRHYINILKRKMYEGSSPLELEHIALTHGNITGIPFDELLAEAKKEFDSENNKFEF